MNDFLYPCEPWAERISLAAAGCLSPGEEREICRHIETCSDCRESFRQLTELCRALAEAPLPADSTEPAIVERIMSAVTADVSRRPIVRTRAKMTHPTLLSRPLATWRWIMRSPVSRISAAVVLAIALGAVAVWFNGGGTAPAFAAFIEPILDAKTVTYETTFEGDGQKITGRVMAIASWGRTRYEAKREGKIKSVRISDDTDKDLTLLPASKVAVVTTYTNVPKREHPKSLFFELRSQLIDARDRPDWIREPLGEKVIAGQRLVGHRLTGHGNILDLWGDPKTGMPVRIESRTPSLPNMKPIIYSNFVFNPHLDESLFSLEPPAGYEVRKQTVDVSPAEEKDLIETFRRYAELCGGALPDQLDLDAFAKLADEDWAKSHPMKGSYPSDEAMQEALNALGKLCRGVSFAFEVLPREADAHYAGKGVKLGAADTPIFWYRPKDAEKYRIIYADLSVREADTSPRVPNAQPVVSASGPKQ